MSLESTEMPERGCLISVGHEFGERESRDPERGRESRLVYQGKTEHEERR